MQELWWLFHIFSWHLMRQDSYYIYYYIMLHTSMTHASIYPFVHVVIYLLVAMYKWIWHTPGRPENARTLPRIMVTFGLVCKDTLVELWKMCRHYVSMHSWRGQCLLATEGLRKKGNIIYIIRDGTFCWDELTVYNVVNGNSILQLDSGWARDHVCIRCFWCLTFCSHNLLPVCACQPWQRLPCW